MGENATDRSQVNGADVATQGGGHVLRTGDCVVDTLLRGRAVTSPDQICWGLYDDIAAAIDERIKPSCSLRYWDYAHPAELQVGTVERLRKERAVRSAFVEYGNPSNPSVLCLGGIANVARRFDWLGHRLQRDFHVIAMDWVGRGRSGWLPEQADYGHATLVQQVLQLLFKLNIHRVSIVGSSLGGNVAMSIAASRPELVEAIVLNDIGPFIPAKRRSRRAQSVARHYVFRRPLDLFLRTGAAQKHDGPIDDITLFYNSHNMTKWSDDESGRIYRYDPRALAAYRAVACDDLNQWDDWFNLQCPVLVIHGLCSDALLPETVEMMAASRAVNVIHVPDTGHTPTLSDPCLIGHVADWLNKPKNARQRVVLPSEPWPQRVLFKQSENAKIPEKVGTAA